MTKYEKLAQEGVSHGLIVKEKPLKASDGRIKHNRIAIRKEIPTSIEKACVLAEELGHHYTSYGNIIDMKDPRNRKQERQARLWAYNKLIGLQGIIRAFEHGCGNRFETAKLLDVTEEFLQEAVDYYTVKYGEFVSVDNYVVYFTPSLGVIKLSP